GTGLTESDSAWIARIAARIPLVWEPNYSVGMTWLAGRLLGVALPPGFDRGILEVHHRGKADRPSGSARALVEALAPPGEGSVSARGRSEAQTDVASLRLEGVPGVHQIWLTGRGEMIRIEHVVLDRAVFARGMFAAAAALWAEGDPTPGRRSLADLW
ncbi:Dihydrodipicolinate reductase, partial [mine drainage metagenome]